MAMRIRPATEHDLDPIQRINDEVQEHPWSREALRSEIALARGGELSTVAEDGVAVLGYCLARRQGDGTELMIIGVTRSAQRRGVGKALIRHLFQHLPGGMEIFLEVAHHNAAALKLYEAMGFKTFHIRKGYYRDGADAVCMKTKVANP